MAWRNKQMLGAGQPVVCEMKGLRRRKVAQQLGMGSVFHGLTFSCTGEFAARVENVAARRGEGVGGGVRGRRGRVGFARGLGTFRACQGRGCALPSAAGGTGTCSTWLWGASPPKGLVGHRAAPQAEYCPALPVPMG